MAMADLNEETKLIIVKAEYGCTAMADVTAKAREWAAQNGGVFDVPSKTTFNSIFGDPEVGKDKLLHIVYKYGQNGPQQEDTWAEAHPDVYVPGVLIRAGQTLTLQITKAVQLRDVRLMGKMCPFVKVECGKENFETKVIEHGGRDVQWGQDFCFNLDGSDQFLKIEAIDKEVIKNDHIGKAKVALSKVILAGGKDVVVSLWHDAGKKAAGDIIIKGTFQDPNYVAPAAATAAAPAPAKPAAAVVVQPVIEIVIVEQAFGNMNLGGEAKKVTSEFKHGRTLVLHSDASKEHVRISHEKEGHVDGKGGPEGKHHDQARWKVHVINADGKDPHIKLQNEKFPSRWLRIDENKALNGLGEGGPYTEFELIVHENGHISLRSRFWRQQNGAAYHVGILPDGKPKPPTETGTGEHGRFRPFFL